VAAQDRNGEHYEIEAEGLLARALQHEIDHLNGILFIDHAPRTLTAEELAATEEDDAPSSEEGNA
jgi:peptide deformylase